MPLLNYLKKAFLYRWNLLAFLGATGFALVSGRADIWIPLVLAGEVTYLGLLAGNPKFRAYVDAQTAQAARQTQSPAVQPGVLVEKILDALPDEMIRRFELLRTRCIELRQIALGIHDPARPAGPATLDQMQLAGLDRLLWIYLRLLYTQHSLQRFLQTTRREEIEQDLRRNEGKLQRVGKEENPRFDKIRKTLQDNLETLKARLANLDKARDNYEIVQAEIDRLENKIRSVSEMAISRQEPDFISGQVDQVASSMIETERTMNELQFVTGLQAVDEQAPNLVQRQTVGQQT